MLVWCFGPCGIRRKEGLASLDVGIRAQVADAKRRQFLLGELCLAALQSSCQLGIPFRSNTKYEDLGLIREAAPFGDDTSYQKFIFIVSVQYSRDYG